MRFFALVVSSALTAGGIGIIFSGDSTGWLFIGIFGLCLFVAALEPWFPRPQVHCEYRLLITSDEIACEHPKRQRESIEWKSVIRIWYVTTSDGPWRPDQWLLLEGQDGGCSFPTEAAGFDGIWDELKKRFTGFNYEPLIQGGTDYAKHLCWEQQHSS